MKNNRAALLVMMMAVFTQIGCQKNGVSDTPFESYNELTVKIDYAAEAGKVYSVILEDKEFADTLQYSNFDKRSVTKTYFSNATQKHLVLVDKQTGNDVIDTMLLLKAKDVITFIQLDAGRPPVMITSASGGEEPDPAAGMTKVRFTYSTDNLPDSITLEILSAPSTLNANNAETFAYDTVGEVKIYKNQFSGYLELNYKKYSPTLAARYVMKIYDARTEAVIMGIKKINVVQYTGMTTQMVRPLGGSGTNPANKFFSLRISPRTTGATQYFGDDFLYGIPW